MLQLALQRKLSWVWFDFQGAVLDGKIVLTDLLALPRGRMLQHIGGHQCGQVCEDLRLTPWSQLLDRIGDVFTAKAVRSFLRQSPRS